jgi:hypothetical protein
MKRQTIIISTAVFLLLIGSTVFAHKFRTRCTGQTVKTSAAYASCSYLDCLSERRYYSVDSIIYIKNRSIRPIKISKVAFMGDQTGIIKEFVNESNTVELGPLALRCFAANNETIPAETYERPRFPPLPGHVAEGLSFHVEWEADTRITPPKITAKIIKPALPLFYVPIMPDGTVCNCEVVDQG